MSVEARLIVTYISILVLEQRSADAIDAIEKVQTANIRDKLLKANLKKLYAIALKDQKKVNGAY